MEMPDSSSRTPKSQDRESTCHFDAGEWERCELTAPGSKRVREVGGAICRTGGMMDHDSIHPAKKSG